MARSIEEILVDFDALNSADYDFTLGNYEGQYRVQALCDELLERPIPEQAIPRLFSVFERLSDADFGAPGALVHMLEKLPGYETELIASVRRKPTYYTVWMINRIANHLRRKAQESGYASWLNLLHEASVHPLADDWAKDEAKNFIAFQQERTDI